MKRRMFLLTTFGVLGSIVAPTAYGKPKFPKGGGKKKPKGHANEELKKKLQEEIERVSGKLDMISQEREKVNGELSSAEAEVEQLKQQLAGMAEDSDEKTDVTRKLRIALSKSKDIQKRIESADALLARGKAYLAQLEAQLSKLEEKKN